MAHIEVFFGAIIFIFALIGLARGFLRELGVTTVMMFLLFFLSQFDARLVSGLERAATLSARVMTVQSQDLFKAWFYVLVIVGVGFVSYQGETLSFGGQPPPGLQGASLGLLTGALNGYLIAGSIWYYLDVYHYPIKWLGFTTEGLSSFAKGMIPLLPTSFLGQEILFGQSLLLLLSALLLFARVIR